MKITRWQLHPGNESKVKILSKDLVWTWSELAVKPGPVSHILQEWVYPEESYFQLVSNQIMTEEIEELIEAKLVLLASAARESEPRPNVEHEGFILYRLRPTSSPVVEVLVGDNLLEKREMCQSIINEPKQQIVSYAYAAFIVAKVGVVSLEHLMPNWQLTEENIWAPI